MRALPLLAVIASLLPALVPPAGSSGADLSVLDEVAYAGDAYVAWRIAGPAGAVARVELRIDPGVAGMAGSGSWVVRPNDLVTGSMGMGFGLQESHLGVQALDPRLAAEVAGPSAVGFTSGRTVPVVLDGAGDWTVIVASAADGEVASVARLLGDDTVRLERRAMGPAFLHREFAFHGAASIVAKGIGAQAKLLVDTALDLPVHGRLFASWWGDNSCGDLRVGASGPAGAFAADVPMARWFHQPYGGTPAGDYRFRIDLNRDVFPCPEPAGGIWPPEVYLVGADVVLP